MPNSSSEKKHLGTGLDALLSASMKRYNTTPQPEPVPLAEPCAEPVASSHEGTAPGVQVVMLPLGSLKSSIYQPRKDFDEERIDELSRSIKEHGLLQPILVKPGTGGTYEIIGGERRYRACRKAGLDPIPCLVKDMVDGDAYALALIENIQRENLNPLEEAEAYGEMIKALGIKQDDLARTLGKSRSAIANLLRLNHLHDDVKKMVREGSIDLGHAKVILSADKQYQPKIAAIVAQKDLSVRQTEDYVRKLKEDPEPEKKPPERKPGHLPEWEHELSERFHGVKVQFVAAGDSKGKITIKFSNDEQLKSLVECLGLSSDFSAGDGEGTADSAMGEDPSVQPADDARESAVTGSESSESGTGELVAGENGLGGQTAGETSETQGDVLGEGSAEAAGDATPGTDPGITDAPVDQVQGA
ncbi:MAG: ParB/RepB/Spo0J family partition protein [Succinivibrionaceae bacterium]|nr:ParB/RepB/Spo0J family partition protein [Succinivibrionaceae bacterium]